MEGATCHRRYQIRGIYEDCLGGSDFVGEITITEDTGEFSGTISDRYGASAIQGNVGADKLSFKKAYSSDSVSTTMKFWFGLSDVGYQYEYHKKLNNSEWDWEGHWTNIRSG